MDIMIFDDHSMMRSGLKACFSDAALYSVVGEALLIIDGAARALTQARWTVPNTTALK